MYELLNQLSDQRREQGRRHQLKLIVILVVMSLMNGNSSLRAMGDFIQRNRKELLDLFQPAKDRLPSHQTIGRTLQHIDFDELSGIFRVWAVHLIKIEDQEWVSVDGKALAGTVANAQNKFQEFIGLVSLFVSQRKQVLGSAKVHSKKDNEILKLRELINLLGLTGTVISADALHCQAETLTSIKASGNDYCIGVKKNQPHLLRAIKKNSCQKQPLSLNTAKEKNRGRSEIRMVKIFSVPAKLDPKWRTVQTVIEVSRQTEWLKGLKKPYAETACFISSLPATTEASIFNEGIRSHWSIENSLHYVKDTTFKEDTCKIRTANAPENLSLLRNIVINTFRNNGFTNIAQAIRLVSNDIPKIWQLLCYSTLKTKLRFYYRGSCRARSPSDVLAHSVRCGRSTGSPDRVTRLIHAILF